MTSPDQPAPGQRTGEGSGDHTAPGAGGGESGDVDPRDPTEDAADQSEFVGDAEAPDPLEPPD